MFRTVRNERLDDTHNRSFVQYAVNIDGIIVRLIITHIHQKPISSWRHNISFSGSDSNFDTKSYTRVDPRSHGAPSPIPPRKTLKDSDSVGMERSYICSLGTEPPSILSFGFSTSDSSTFTNHSKFFGQDFITTTHVRKWCQSFSLTISGTLGSKCCHFRLMSHIGIGIYFGCFLPRGNSAHNTIFKKYYEFSQVVL